MTQNFNGDKKDCRPKRIIDKDHKNTIAKEIIWRTEQTKYDQKIKTLYQRKRRNVSLTNADKKRTVKSIAEKSDQEDRTQKPGLIAVPNVEKPTQGTENTN